MMHRDVHGFFSQASKQMDIVRFDGLRGSQVKSDTVAVEEPLEIRVHGKALVVTMRTPGHDPELAAGYLWSEGVIQEPWHILEMAHCQDGPHLNDNILNVFLHPDVAIVPECHERFSYAASGCGLCGKSTIESIQSHFPPLQSGFRVAASVLHGILASVQERQCLFDQTGGVHAAALFRADGSLVEIMEDVGRHNAVDKVIGAQLRGGDFPFEEGFLFVSSRASFEIVQKACSARIPMIVCASAPSSLAIDFALANRQTLIGFLRDHRFNAYTYPERVEER
ncbi:formate dehydrogenase accessory sulfurtransferase FdhD [Verrucomicrobia bacterium]|nr:formate dehydrogenase accessory sulfurtransferase FdhD [Verrucomicrobiota bacterium]